MKKSKILVSMLLVLCAALMCASALAEAPTQAEIIENATKAVRDVVTISDEDWSKLRVDVYDEPLEGHSESVWSVQFTLPLSDIQCTLYTVALEKHTGGVLRVYAEQNAFDDAVRSNEGCKVMRQWLEEKGDMYYWSMQDTVDFFEKYEDGIYKMPEEGDLSRDAVIEIATKYAADNWGMSVDYLSGLYVCTNLQKETEDLSSRWYVYFVDENIRTASDGVLAPHMVTVANPSGEVINAFQGDPNGLG